MTQRSICFCWKVKKIYDWIKELCNCLIWSIRCFMIPSKDKTTLLRATPSHPYHYKQGLFNGFKIVILLAIWSQIIVEPRLDPTNDFCRSKYQRDYAKISDFYPRHIKYKFIKKSNHEFQEMISKMYFGFDHQIVSNGYEIDLVIREVWQSCRWLALLLG